MTDLTRRLTVRTDGEHTPCMPRRGRHPSFGPDQVAYLLGDMRSVRHQAILCGAATGFGSARHQKVEALTKAIDALAEDLTGDPKFYWDKSAPSQSQRA